MGAIKRYIGSRFRFDRNEFSGAFGDIGTTFPLIAGMIVSSGMDGAAVVMVFGLMQIGTAFIYGIPMPVQPLKAVALIVITQKIGGGIIAGAGLGIGVVMLLMTLSGLIDHFARIMPRSVIRGIQMGLGIQLATLALKDYVPSASTPGYVVAGITFVVTIALIGNRRIPPAPIVILIGIAYALYSGSFDGMTASPSFYFPHVMLPAPEDMITGFLLLAIPQIPLSLGNSIFASGQMIKDFFPDKKVKASKISLTYSLMNIVSPFIGGIPVCHGSGGMAGHYAFGARTGASVLICGIICITLGFFGGENINSMISIFPKPVLGVILFFESLSLINLVKDTVPHRNDFMISLLVAFSAVGFKYGYLIGMAIGIVLHHVFIHRKINIPDTVSTFKTDES